MRSNLGPLLHIARRAARRSGELGMMKKIRASEMMPTGTFIRKHQCQDQLSLSHPPSVGPTTGATTTAMP